MEMTIQTARRLDRKPDTVDLQVAGRIRDRRKALGISQKALAEKMALTFQAIGKYESGKGGRPVRLNAPKRRGKKHLSERMLIAAGR